jgi:hypothetical protein
MKKALTFFLKTQNKLIEDSFQNQEPNNTDNGQCCRYINGTLLHKFLGVLISKEPTCLVET